MPRAKAFDPETALDRAVELFWRRGYDGSSMTMLLEFMGISRQSLYDTFLDKHHLYLAAIDRYRLMLHEQLKRLLDEKSSGRDGIRAVFELVDREVLDHPEHRSCLLANAALELGQRDEAVRERVAAHLADLEELFFGALERARADGEIESQRNTRAQARCLTSTIHGLGVLARGGADRQVLEDTIASTLALV